MASVRDLVRRFNEWESGNEKPENEEFWGEVEGVQQDELEKELDQLVGADAPPEVRESTRSQAQDAIFRRRLAEKIKAKEKPSLYKPKSHVGASPVSLKKAAAGASVSTVAPGTTATVTTTAPEDEEVEETGEAFEYEDEQEEVEVEEEEEGAETTTPVVPERLYQPGEDVVVHSYWDDETEKYWMITSEGQFRYWDDEEQGYIFSPDGGPAPPESFYEAVRQVEAEAAGEEGEIEDEEEWAEYNEEQIAQSLDAAENLRRERSKLEKPPESQEQFKKSAPTALQGVAHGMKISSSVLERFQNNVDVYAFVKKNKGMLKPLKMNIRPDLGKIYITRNETTQFLHIEHLGQLSTSRIVLKGPDAHEYEESVAAVQESPYVMLWTNEYYNQATRKKNAFAMPKMLKKALGKTKPMTRKMLLLVFDTEEDRDDLKKIVIAMHRKFNTELRVTK